MTQNKDFKQTCQTHQDFLDQLNVGAVSASKTISLEHEIMELKEMEEFIDSKIKVLRVSDIPSKSTKDLDNDLLKSELQEKMLKLKITESAAQNILLGHVLECVQSKTKEEIAFQIYKEKVLKQLEKLKDNCEIARELFIKRQEAINTNINFNLTYKKQVDFSELLQEKKEDYEKRHTGGDEVYETHMERVNQRIIKINFMRVLMNRLLFCLPIDLRKNPELKDILKNGRDPVTIDSLLKD